MRTVYAEWINSEWLRAWHDVSAAFDEVAIHLDSYEIIYGDRPHAQPNPL